MGCGNVYLTINFSNAADKALDTAEQSPATDNARRSTRQILKDHASRLRKNPIEIFMRLGKSGACQSSLLQGLARVASLALQAGVPPEALAKTLGGIACTEAPPGEPGETFKSCLDFFSFQLREASREAKHRGVAAGAASPQEE